MMSVKHSIVTIVLSILFSALLITGVVALALPSGSNDAHLLRSEETGTATAPQGFYGGVDEDVCSSPDTDGEVDDCLWKIPTREEKSYATFGSVKRQGVVLPVTTLFNVYTRESLPIFEVPAVKPELLQHFFRCRGFGETIEMAPELLEAILNASRHFESRRATIISGYRSPKFNDALAKKGRRVAAESRHMKGQAVDFRLDTVTADKLGPWLRSHFDGGVGTYRGDNFVHIDVGPKRSWEGH